MTSTRRRLGSVGEELAVWFLERHGATVVGRNVVVGRGELDIVAHHGTERVAVEVRTITGDHEPLAAFDHAKAEQVARLASAVGAHRVDVVALRLGVDAAEIRWVRGAG